MRIAVVTNAYPPESRGGAGVIAADLVELWRAQGHEVRVWSRYAAWLRSHALRRLVGHLWDDRVGGADLVHEVAAWNADIVVTHNLTGLGWTIGRRLQAAGAKWIHILHDVQLFEPSGTVYSTQITWWQRWWGWYRRSMFGVPDRLIAPTQWLLDQHALRGFGRTASSLVIPNPLPDVGVHPLVEPIETRWTYVGNMTDQKGLSLIDQLAKARPTEAFTCIGDGSWRHTLGVLPNVRCLGQIPRELVLRELVQARGVLVPSRLIENQPTVILEAFALGVPVIAAASGGIPETVGTGGQVVALEHGAWMHALDEVNRAPEAWQKRAVEQRTRFDRATVSVQWGKVLLQLLSERKTHTPTLDRP